MSNIVKIGVLASGGGSNFEALVKAGIPGAEFRLLIVNKPGAGALDRAKKLGVESLVLDPKTFPDRAAFYAAAADALEKRGVSLVCLAGFLLKVEPNFIRRFPNRILNIHPALLPQYGGKGMWGHHVHEAVLAAGEKESGCTVHLVDDEFDHGAIAAQVKVPVLPGDTPDTLAARVLVWEHLLYPQVVTRLVHNAGGFPASKYGSYAAAIEKEVDVAKNVLGDIEKLTPEKISGMTRGQLRKSWDLIEKCRKRFEKVLRELDETIQSVNAMAAWELPPADAAALPALKKEWTDRLRPLREQLADQVPRMTCGFPEPPDSRGFRAVMGAIKLMSWIKLPFAFLFHRRGLKRFYILRDAAGADLAAASALIAKDPSIVHARDLRGETALHFLAIEDRRRAVHFLAEKGADVNTRDKYGQTPLEAVREMKLPHMEALLLRLGARDSKNTENPK